MPFIKTKTSFALTEAQENRLKEKFGEAIELIPGKSEQYLLLEFEDNCRLWLRGRNEDSIVYIEVAIFGNEDHYCYDAFTSEITKAFSDTLGVRPDHIFIKFEDIGIWGTGGMCFDRRQYR
ncbi:MAG: hypothetical protein IJI14_08745 [Anaerolineaceae bacterium]|nr:hypothetical protein [Anaerolineaceae bacterium]